MSYVCDTLLTFSVLESEQERIIDVNKFFEDEKGFVLLDCNSLPEQARYWYGGCKVFQNPLAVGAFNYLDLEGLKKHLYGIKWEHPESVQLIYCNENDELFNTWMLGSSL